MVEIYLERGHRSGYNEKFAATFEFFFSEGYRCFLPSEEEIDAVQVQKWVDARSCSESNFFFNKGALSPQK